MNALRRIRVRLWESLAVLALVLPDILDAIGAIDLNPILHPIFGDQRTAVMNTIIMIALAVMRPIVHIKPKDC
jgi:hypothetical protein